MREVRAAIGTTGGPHGDRGVDLTSFLTARNCLRLRAWWQSPLSSSSNASAPNLRLIVENHVQQGTVDFDAAVVINQT